MASRLDAGIDARDDHTRPRSRGRTNSQNAFYSSTSFDVLLSSLCNCGSDRYTVDFLHGQTARLVRTASFESKIPISSTTRAELVRRARNKDTRTNTFSEKEPCEWRPRQVAQPGSGLPFTDVSAWNFIADLLESGCEVKEVVLEKPGASWAG